MIKKIIPFLATLCCLCSSQHTFSQQAAAFSWLHGTWTMRTGSGVIVESWQPGNDSTLLGKSFFVKGTDTIPQETIELALRGGSWYYTPTVQGQNNNQPVAFKVVYQKGTELVCENPAHDFPQRISYRKTGAAQLQAYIEGTKNGRFGRQHFSYTKQDGRTLFSISIAVGSAALPADTEKQQQQWLDSLGKAGALVFSTGAGSAGKYTVVVRAAGMEAAKTIAAAAPLAMLKTTQTEVTAIAIQSWFPGNYGKN